MMRCMMEVFATDLRGAVVADRYVVSRGKGVKRG